MKLSVYDNTMTTIFTSVMQFCLVNLTNTIDTTRHEILMQGEKRN